jgi:hypothetical protein
MRKPICNHCGRQLVKHTHKWNSKDKDDKTPEPKVGQKTIHGVVQQIIRVTDSETFGRWVSFWCGEWGRYGDDRFCGLRCGYMWAKKRAPIIRAKLPH